MLLQLAFTHAQTGHTQGLVQLKFRRDAPHYHQFQRPAAAVRPPAAHNMGTGR